MNKRQRKKQQKKQELKMLEFMQQFRLPKKMVLTDFHGNPESDAFIRVLKKMGYTIKVES